MERSTYKNKYDIIDVKECAESRHEHLQFTIRSVPNGNSTDYFLDLIRFRDQKFETPLKTTLSVNSKNYLDRADLDNMLNDIRQYLGMYGIEKRIED
jgi:hypothetical protein